MTHTLRQIEVQELLARLHAAAEVNDPPLIDRAVRQVQAHGGSDREIADLLSEAYMPVSPEVGQLLYWLARTGGAKRIVEFGTSFGLSTIYLAAAVRDGGAGGRVITTELNAAKVSRAREHVAAAGLSEFVEFREGDARETLRAVEGTVDLVLLDGWKDLYLPVLRTVEPALRSGALVIADDIHLFPEAHMPLRAYLGDAVNGYLTAEVSVGDGLLLAHSV